MSQEQALRIFQHCDKVSHNTELEDDLIMLRFNIFGALYFRRAEEKCH